MANINLLTEPEVAEILRMSQRSVRNARERGDLPHLRIGRLIRYRADDLEGFLAVASIAAASVGTKQERNSRHLRAPSRPKIRPFSQGPAKQ